MKSYFAKLAARATFANLPVSSGGATETISDPFEQTSLFKDMAPASAVASPGPAKDSVEPGSREGALPQTQPVNQKLERADSVPLKPERTTSLSPRWQPEIELVELPNEVRPGRQTTGIDSKSRSEHYGLEQPPPRDAAELLPKAEPTLVAPSSYESHESEKVNAKGIPDNDERFAEIEREQAVLLRKSDAFMESLLRHHEAPTKSHEVQSEAAEPRVSTRREEPVEQRQSRLQPSPAPRAPEPADDRPSLVIGSLTVEVVPPTSTAPVAPRREVVIVRGAPNVRSAVPSSRRFGLGQF